MPGKKVLGENLASTNLVGKNEAPFRRWGAGYNE
jgi:hypothetical protein